MGRTCGRAKTIHDPGNATSPRTVQRIGGEVSQPLVRPPSVVEGEVLGEPQLCLRHGGVALEGDVLELHAAPQPLDEEVGQRASPSAHNDGDPGV